MTSLWCHLTPLSGQIAKQPAALSGCTTELYKRPRSHSLAFQEATESEADLLCFQLVVLDGKRRDIYLQSERDNVNW